MRSQPGAELSCRGLNYNLPPGAGAQGRGVLSYYATAALPAAHSMAHTMADWLTHIESQAQRDVEAGHLPVFYRPQLQLLGDGAQPIFYV